MINNRLGYSSKLKIYPPINGFVFFISFTLFLSSEKRATSEPEKKADNTKHPMSINILAYQSISKKLNKSYNVKHIN